MKRTNFYLVDKCAFFVGGGEGESASIPRRLGKLAAVAARSVYLIFHGCFGRPTTFMKCTSQLAGFACCTPSPNEKGTAVPCLFHLGVIYEKDTKFYEGAKTDEGGAFLHKEVQF